MITYPATSPGLVTNSIIITSNALSNLGSELERNAKVLDNSFPLGFQLGFEDDDDYYLFF